MAKKRMINGKMPVNEVRQVGEGARGELPPALRATSPAAAEEAGDAGNVQDEQSWPVGVKGPIGVEQVRQAALTLQEYNRSPRWVCWRSGWAASWSCRAPWRRALAWGRPCASSSWR